MSSFYPSPIQADFIQPTDSFYRIISGTDYDSANSALLDLQRSGAVRGTDTFGKSAFFNQGYPDAQYYSQINSRAYDGILNNFGARALPTNYVIEANPMFMNNINSGNNPLYVPQSLYNQGGGGYYSISPSSDTSFTSRINPANRVGLKITQFIGSDIVQPQIPVGGEHQIAGWSRNPNASVIYDTTQPFNKTSLPQHAKNAIYELGTFLEQPEVANVANKANTFMNYAGIVPIASKELLRAKSDYENPVTQEVYKKGETTYLDGLTYANADLETIARFHPDNAEDHPEITDEMRKKFNPKWFE